MNSVSSSSQPVRVGRRSDWERVWSGLFFACARGSDGLWCWGDNGMLQLGTGTASPMEMEPVKTIIPDDFVTMAIGGMHSCALLADGGVRCWGRSNVGQLGDGSTADSSPPVDAALDVEVLQIDAGVFHTCATVVDGVRCWGAGPEGQLGTGTTAEPLPVVAFADVGATEVVVATFQRSCARTPGGQTFCAGRNDVGQFGNGQVSPDPVITPEAVPAVDGLQIVGGVEHGCGLAEDGTLLCWGGNEHGQVGNGSTVASLSPVQIGDSTWAFAAAGSFNSCAIDVDGLLWCWGQNDMGQVGNGTFDSPITEPTEVLEGLP